MCPAGSRLSWPAPAGKRGPAAQGGGGGWAVGAWGPQSRLGDWAGAPSSGSAQLRGPAPPEVAARWLPPTQPAATATVRPVAPSAASREGTARQHARAQDPQPPTSPPPSPPACHPASRTSHFPRSFLRRRRRQPSTAPSSSGLTLLHNSPMSFLHALAAGSRSTWAGASTQSS